MYIIKFIVKFLWELPSNLLAVLLFFFLGVDGFEFDKQRGIVVVTMSYQGGLTLGCFIFVSKESRHVLPHEYGHIRQGWVTGPLYLFIIGIPSLIWCLIYKSTGKPYDWFYTERWLMDDKG